MNQILDFRSILFNNGAADNARLTVDFSDGTQFIDELNDLTFASNEFAHLAANGVNTIPEPTTLAVWSALACVASAWCLRRARRASGSA